MMALKRWGSLSVLIALSLGASALAAQQSTPVHQGSGSALLWQDPGDIEARDLFWGSGSQERAPQPPFTFVEEKLTGTTPKVVVTDARGDRWDVKLGVEAHAEVAANRLLWALGYLVQEMYYLPKGTITGVTELRRAKDTINKRGEFAEARFRRQQADVTEAGGWAFADNPFKGQKELSGLIVLMAVINNWDTEGTNNKDILTVKQPDGTTQTRYIVQDLGASFGHFQGPRGTPIKWSVNDFRRDRLIERVDPEAIDLNYPAYGTPPDRIPLEHARWIAGLASRLTQAQVRRAFEAAGAMPDQVNAFSEVVLSKIGELRSAAGGGSTRQDPASGRAR